MTLFNYHRAVWLHQLDQLAEADVAAVAATMKQYAGADVLLWKVMDGTDWMGTFDTSPNAIKSLAVWQATVAQGATAGITVVPWVVANQASDAAAHAQLGPVLIIDLEPYAQFWTDSAANVPVYLAALRAGGVQQIYVSIDPRDSATSALNVSAWAHTVDGLLPQLYWTDFGQPENPTIPNLEVEIEDYHVPQYPVYPYNGSAADMQNAWQAAVGDGCLGCSLWKLGTADAAQLQAFAALPLPTAPVPTPTPAPVPVMTNDNAIYAIKQLAPTDGPLNPAAAVAYLQQFVPSSAAPSVARFRQQREGD